MTPALALIRARRAMAAAGFGPDVPIERASSVTNEVWLTRDAVLRINTQGDQRLRREALVAAALPPDIGYPHLIAYGGDLSSDWLVVERVPGRPLSRCWPTMSREARRAAVGQLADRLRLLHLTPAPELPPLRDQPQLLQPALTGTEAVAPLIAGLRRAAGLPRVNPRLMMDLEALVEETASALEPFDATTLVHGDLTFENVLWHPQEQRVTAILDFEWARRGPADLDLDVLLRCVAYPKLHVAADYEHLTKTEDYAEVPYWLCESYPELFSFPRQLERVRLYAIAWDVRELLRFPPSNQPGELHPAHPYHRLMRTINGTSYLDTMDGSVPVPGAEQSA
jgi:aminoglycoside phosphotransferase (APT) family kinase protein